MPFFFFLGVGPYNFFSLFFYVGEEGESPKKKRDIENREDGELSDEEDDDSLLRQEPKTVCR